MTLFRQQVFDARKDQWLGATNTSVPLSGWVHVAIALAFSGAALLLLFCGSYTRRESVTGQLVPKAGLINIIAMTPAVVSRVQIKVGDQVHVGDNMFELSGEQDSGAFRNTHQLITQELEDQRSRLTADLQTLQQVAEQKTESLRKKIRLLNSQLVELDGQLALQSQQVRSAEALLERIRPLIAKSYVSAVQVQQQETAVLEARGQYKSLQRQQFALREDSESATQQLAQLPFDTDIQKNETERKLADITKSIAQNEILRATTLRSVTNGVVSSVSVNTGQSVAAGQLIASVFPADSTLQAQLIVPSRAMGFLSVGDTVVLRYRAFPYQKFGQQFGHVALISHSALTQSELAFLTGNSVSQQTQEPLFRVDVSLDRQDIVASRSPESLSPGMAVDADILMERRRLIEWVFEPLYGLHKWLQVTRST